MSKPNEWYEIEFEYLERERDKYKSTLETIKSIVDCAKCEYDGSDNCNPQQCDKIERKINEVLK